MPQLPLAFISLMAAAGLGMWAWLLDRRLRQQTKHMRQTRFIAERYQAMLRAAPGGYCLFTPQGLLREVARVPQILGIEKIAHFEDIVGALKDSGDFVAAFRT